MGKNSVRRAFELESQYVFFLHFKKDDMAH